MKYFFIFFIVLIVHGCSESGPSVMTDSGAAVFSQPNDPFGDLNPERDSADGAAIDAGPEEKWFGLDSEDDTVIYEQDGKILTSGYVTGTFERVDRGDFMHFVVRDSNGYLHSFFMNTGNQRQMDKYFEGYEPARGHPVTVKWIRGPLSVSDGGTMVTLYQAKEIVE